MAAVRCIQSCVAVPAAEAGKLASTLQLLRYECSWGSRVVPDGTRLDSTGSAVSLELERLACAMRGMRSKSFVARTEPEAMAKSTGGAQVQLAPGCFLFASDLWTETAELVLIPKILHDLC